jgi:hypothetical protein
MSRTAGRHIERTQLTSRSPKALHSLLDNYYDRAERNNTATESDDLYVIVEAVMADGTVVA